MVDTSPGSWGSWGTGIGGLLSAGGSVFGAESGAKIAGQINADYGEIAKSQAQENQLRRTQMELQTRRQETETRRMMQSSAALSMAIGTNQGGGGFQTSSAAGGAAGAISGMGNTAFSQLATNASIGEKMFDENQHQYVQQMKLAEDQMKAQSSSGLSGMFGNIGKSLGSIAELASVAVLL